MEAFGINPLYLLLQIGVVIMPLLVVVGVIGLLIRHRKKTNEE